MKRHILFTMIPGIFDERKRPWIIHRNQRKFVTENFSFIVFLTHNFPVFLYGRVDHTARLSKAYGSLQKET